MLNRLQMTMATHLEPNEMIKDFEQRVAMCLKSLEPMELVIVMETEQVQSYYIKQPKTRMMSTLVTFTPEGIVLQGDFTPEHNGSASCIGYERAWFAGQLSPEYLASKFLTHKWSCEVAVEKLRWMASDEYDLDNRETRRALLELANHVECSEADQSVIYERFLDLGLETADGIPGWGYDPNEAARLVAIQRKFAELWAKRTAEPRFVAIQRRIAELLAMRPKEYYILSLRYGDDGTCTWWRPNNAGYTGVLESAGKYTEDDALTEYHNDGVNAIAVPCEIALKYACSLVDVGGRDEMLREVRSMLEE